jgi:hypothetical protein
MNITLQYFDHCPNWNTTSRYLIELIEELGFEIEIGYQLIETPEAAAEHHFRGSPTVLIDGVDPFANPDAPYGLSCRIYLTDQGPAGSPSRAQLRAALEAAA